MQPAKLLYMEDMQQLECDAVVEGVETKDGKTIVYLDQTVFYPQGGGQPYDQGVIKAGNITFAVEEVRFVEGQVQHIGHFNGPALMEGEDVHCVVHADRRKLHTRLHSGGHVLDMAVSQLGYEWVPGKGYHFPDGPYVEYKGDLTDEAEAVISRLDTKLDEILSQDLQTEIRFMPKEEMAQYCRHVPDYLPAGKPGRIVLYGDFGVPCGGTHVARLQDIGHVKVRKIKAKAGTIRVSYEVTDV